MSRVRPIIDVHVHLYPERRLGGLMRWVHRGIPGHPVPADIAVERVVADLRDAGVERFLAAVFPLKPGEARELNRFNAELARTIPEMIPLGTVHQDDEDPADVVREGLVDFGLKGIKFHPMMMAMDINDRRIAPAYALAQEMGLPVLVHTGFEEGSGRATAKEEWERLFRSFPRLVFLLSHMFFPDLAYGFSLLSRFDNLYLDCTNVFGMLLYKKGPLPFGVSRPALGNDEFAAAVEANAERIVFGSDHPAGMGTIEGILRQIENFGLEEKTVRAILYGNARKLLERLGI